MGLKARHEWTGFQAHPTITIKIISYLIRDPNLTHPKMTNLKSKI